MGREDRGKPIYEELVRTVEEEVRKNSPRDATELSAILYKRNKVNFTMHPAFDTVANRLIDAERHFLKDELWYDIMVRHGEDFYTQRVNAADVTDSVAWIEKIVDHNGFDPAPFFRTIKGVVDRDKPKLNSLLFYGPPNSGKSLLAESIAESCIATCNVSQLSGKSSFEFAPMIGSRCILINEPCFTDLSVETCKNIMEGMRVTVEVKYKTGQSLDRTPIILTTNNPLAFNTRVREVNERALAARCFKYTFKQFDDLVNLQYRLHPFAWKVLIDKYC